ncbi:MAG: acyl carrier protein [Myxococcales bacterium]|nr:acyl carrier protein [Myxococcales bacterium]MCB9643873.1 acyl carrier protein [Myxococcales bacterium]
MTKDKILAIVKTNLLDILEDVEEDAITSDKSMKDLGANSLDIVEVVSTSMRELKVKVPRAKLNDLKNIGELVDVLYEEVQAKADA